jgi:glycosyltransferase involved in cell wall biosynthesis
MKPDLSVIILTYNEEKHIARCINSISSIVKNVFIVDSYSTDKTIEIAESLGAKVYQHEFINQAKQFQWGLDNCPINTEWVMRMDADEYILPELREEIKNKLPNIPKDISGIYIKRRVKFMGKWIKHGGYYPTWLLRIWRYTDGKMEERWMDEHIKLLKGKSANFENDIVDENLNNLTWWTNKHNNYATREAIDLLNYIYNFKKYDEVEPNFFGTQEQRKRWLKIKYAKMPLFIRPIIYYIYRYAFKLGFLDGREGLIWHFLQGGWYRFLVDAKIYEIYKFQKKNNVDIKTAIEQVSGVKL